MKPLLWSILLAYGTTGICVFTLLYFLRPKKRRIEREAERIARATYSRPLLDLAPPVVRSTEQKRIIAWAWEYVEKTS